MPSSLYVILFLLIAQSNIICEPSNNEFINRLITHGERSIIQIPRDLPHFEHIIINHDVRKFNLFVDIYRAQLPCGHSARLYVKYTTSNGKPVRIGPLCGRIKLQPIISYHGNVKLYIDGYIRTRRRMNIRVYEKLLPATTFPITTTTPTPTTVTTTTTTTTPTTISTSSSTTTTTPTTTSTSTSTTTTTSTTTSTTSATPSTTSTSTSTTTTTPTITSTSTISTTTSTATATATTTTVTPSICGKELEANAGNICFTRLPNWIPDCSTCSMTLKIPSSQKSTAIHFRSFRFSTKDYDCINSTVIIKSKEGIKFFCSESPPNIGESIFLRSNYFQIQTSIKWKETKDYKSGFDVKFFGIP